jgi:hypothetical protein
MLSICAHRQCTDAKKLLALPQGIEADHELHVALRQRQVGVSQVHPRTCDGLGVTGGNVARELLACLRRESRDGRAGSDFEAVIATSFHESPVPR